MQSCPTLDSALTLGTHCNLDTWMNDPFCLDIFNAVSVKAIPGLVKCYWCNLGPGVALSTHTIYLPCLILPKQRTCSVVRPTFYNTIEQKWLSCLTSSYPDVCLNSHPLPQLLSTFRTTQVTFDCTFTMPPGSSDFQQDLILKYLSLQICINFMNNHTLSLTNVMSWH